MKTKINPASDDEIVQVKLSMKQVRLLSKLAGAELDDVYYSGSPECQTTLEALCELFGSYTHIPMTPEDEKADSERFEAWAKRVVTEDETRLRQMKARGA